MTKEDTERLTCTKCRVIKQTYSEIVYSQGNRVCWDCEEENMESDKSAFDIDMGLRQTAIWRES